MTDLKKRGFKKPLENKAYDIKVTNFNTNKLKEELDKKVNLVDGRLKSNQLPEIDYTHINHSHTTVNGYTVPYAVKTAYDLTNSKAVIAMSALATNLLRCMCLKGDVV